MEAEGLTVCVINYQGAEYLEDTLDAVAGLTGPVREVLVVDDRSSDGSDRIAEGRDGVVLIRMESNQGPAAARNAGYASAAYPRVLFVDNDVLPEPDCARVLVAELERTGATVAVPRVVYHDRPDLIQYEGATAHFTGLMGFRHADTPEADVPDGTVEIDSLMTACFLIDRGRWGNEPPFDEMFSYLLEDHDFGLRARITGHRIVAVSAARCRHRAGTPGLSLRREGQYVPQRVANLIRGRWLILARLYRLRTLVLLAPPLMLFEILQLGGALRKGWLGHWWHSATWIARHAGEVWRSRRQVQAARVVSDAQILDGREIPFSARLLRGGVEARVGRWLNAFSRGWWHLVRKTI